MDQTWMKWIQEPNKKRCLIMANDHYANNIKQSIDDDYTDNE